MRRIAPALSEGAIRRARHFIRGASYARAVIGEPITVEEAMNSVRTRLATRAQAFLETIERAIFACPDSPYRPLLDVAGYDLARLRRLVAARGVEGALHRLCEDGVYVCIEEFKGIRDARRGAHTFRFSEGDFKNPLLYRRCGTDCEGELISNPAPHCF